MLEVAHWYYFISLEKDFIRTLDFVELATANHTTYSDNFAKLLLAVGSEVDTIAKAICHQLSATSEADTIMKYRDELTAGFLGIHTIDILVMRTAQTLNPWTEWGIPTPTSPSWWKGYNNVKHNRIINLNDANQENCINALAGLFALNLYYYRDQKMVAPFPKLLNFHFPQYLVDTVMTRPPGA